MLLCVEFCVIVPMANKIISLSLTLWIFSTLLYMRCNVGRIENDEIERIIRLISIAFALC